MLKLSAIGLDTTHGFIYPAMLNGYDPQRFTANSVEHVWSIFPTNGEPSIASNGRVVACYDPGPGLARRVAEACRIERVCTSLDDAIKDVDGVLVLSGDATIHRTQAGPALEAGLATFVDKPFTQSVADAEGLAELAERHQAPLFCTSALRFAPHTVALRERLERSVGTPLAAHSIGTGEYESYAVHSLEILFGLWGGGITGVHSAGQDGFVHHSARLRRRPARGVAGVPADGLAVSCGRLRHGRHGLAHDLDRLLDRCWAGAALDKLGNARRGGAKDRVAVAERDPGLINFAINRQDVAEKVYGGEAEVSSVMPTGYGDWPLPVAELKEKWVKFDLNKAKQLMVDAGYADGFAITCQSFATPRDYTQAAEVVREHLKPLKIDMTVQPLEPGTFATTTAWACSTCN
jgi:Bacterial extracellular solute-binding proteins, family 5 Middle/Oxidoreductase family, NAD-binding Rossmann fold